MRIITVNLCFGLINHNNVVSWIIIELGSVAYMCGKRVIYIFSRYKRAFLCVCEGGWRRTGVLPFGYWI